MVSRRRLADRWLLMNDPATPPTTVAMLKAVQKMEQACADIRSDLVQELRALKAGNPSPSDLPAAPERARRTGGLLDGKPIFQRKKKRIHLV